MRKLAGFGVVTLVLGVTTVFMGSTAAMAATCTGSSLTGTGTVTVASGQTCTLTGVTINAPVVVQPGASLSLTNSLVKGTVTATQAADVDLQNTFTRGLVISGSAGAGNTFSLCNDVFGGAVSISGVTASVIYGGAGCNPNRQCGSLTARGNTGTLSIKGNTVSTSGQVVNNSQLSTFTGNKFGGGLTATGNSPNNGSSNTTSDVSASSQTCPEEVPPVLTYKCPAQDKAGFPLDTTFGSPLDKCSYPVFAGENPNDFFCAYSATTGVLTQDHDAGLCPNQAPTA